MRFREAEFFFFKQKFINIEVCEKDDKSFPIKTDLESQSFSEWQFYADNYLCDSVGSGLAFKIAKVILGIWKWWKGYHAVCFNDGIDGC